MKSTVLFLTGDLIFASRVRAACETAGKNFAFAGRLPEEPDEDIGWVIVDLSTRNGVVADLMPTVSRICPDAIVIAYGPHVQVDRLKKAREAGVPTVLTRGQFDASLSSLFTD
ncbi:histidine kinase [Rhodopirellula sp. JC740]|uniref:Histidine kinase n=1 Tax=Rhodopirellula halodulae TaxID=2894198 RepID=A0ABS8NNW5_9BACT|nr:histidine kinase [Rhodopirellula sp. JC740]MCC9645258.1 histidine kinase [Rhodopirellula sp. JC740]